MAGEIQEPPFSHSFQVDLLHSESISFGRFEAESLCWERRSSFSHNRYLEEVEKYSKPGSVTEKKAYFEAHFKKKALLSRSSSESQNGSEYQTSENDVLENMGYREEIEHLDEGNHSEHFDHSPGHSEYDAECKVMEYEREETRVFYSQTQVEPAFNNANVVHCSHEFVKSEETHETGNAESEMEVKEKPNIEIAIGGVTSKAIAPSPNSEIPREDDSISCEHLKDPSPKARTATETKSTKARLNSQVNVTKVHRNISSKASKEFTAKPSRRERDTSPRTKTAKQISQTDFPTARSMRTIPESEDSNISKAKAIHGCKRNEKELRNKEVVDSQPSASEKVITKAHQTANRPKQAVSSTKQGMKQSAASFCFKSDQRAERRKEFNMKLEGKIHAKEAEMNQIQAKTLKKTESEIKQFRRSLNFKATPMPSFYHEAGRGSDKNKAVSSKKKSIKLSKTSSSKAENDQALDVGAPANTTDSPQVTGATKCLSPPSETSTTSFTPATNRHHPPQAEMDIMINGDKGKEKNSRKQKVLDGGKLMKGQKAEGKQKLGSGTRGNDTMKKDMNSIGMGSGSGMGHLAVGVAS